MNPIRLISRYDNCAVIGGAGFLGSHLVDHLVNDRGCNVLIVDNLCVGRKEFICHKAKFVHADITESESFLRKLFQSHSIHYVFNYAAHPYVPDSFDRPLHVFNTNATGAMNVINAAQEAGVKGILQIGSAEVFGDQHGKITEDCQVTPHSTYGASKAAIDFMCQARWREAKTPVIVARQFNCYGPRPLHRYVIPEIIQQIYEYGPNIKLGNNSTRDFQYAEDAVKTAVELLEYGDFGEVYNTGSEESIKIYDLAQLIGHIMGYREVNIEVDPVRVRPWEIWNLMACCDKLKATIPERKKISFYEGLTRTVESFKVNNNSWGF